MEKFFDIVCRVGGIRPAATVLVATVKALKHHGGDPDGGLEAIERGAANMIRHLGIIREFGLNAVVALNRFPDDTDEEIELVRRLALENGAYAAEVERGRDARAARARRRSPRPSSPRPRSRTSSTSSTRSTRRSSRRSRRSRSASTAPTGSSLLKTAQDKIRQFNAAGFDKLPICMAKTHLSLSHDAALTNAPTGLHGHDPRHPRLHRRRLARRALRRHADDAGPQREPGRVQRRHRRGGPDGWPLLIAGVG